MRLLQCVTLTLQLADIIVLRVVAELLAWKKPLDVLWALLGEGVWWRDLVDTYLEEKGEREAGGE